MNIVETPSKKDQVRNYLIQELNSGKYPPGSMFLSENITPVLTIFKMA